MTSTSRRRTSIWRRQEWPRLRTTTSCDGFRSTAVSRPTTPPSKKGPFTGDCCPTARGKMRFGATVAGPAPQHGFWCSWTAQNCKRWVGRSCGKTLTKRSKCGSPTKGSAWVATVWPTVNSCFTRPNTTNQPALSCKPRGRVAPRNGPTWTSKVTFAPTTAPPSRSCWVKA